MNVEEAIKTTRPIPPKTRTLIHLTLVHHLVNETMAQALKPFGVSLQQFNVLRILRGHGSGPANLSTLNERMVSKMSNTTRLVDKLLAKGFVSRAVCPTNRRKVEIDITEEGRKALKVMDQAVSDAEETVLSRFDDSDLEAFNRLLDKF